MSFCSTSTDETQDDGGEAADGLPVRGVQRGGGAQGAQVPLRAPQGAG